MKRETSKQSESEKRHDPRIKPRGFEKTRKETDSSKKKQPLCSQKRDRKVSYKSKLEEQIDNVRNHPKGKKRMYQRIKSWTSSENYRPEI